VQQPLLFYTLLPKITKMILGIIATDVKFYTVRTIKINLYFKKFTFYIFSICFKDGKRLWFTMKSKARVDNLIQQIVNPGLDRRSLLNKFDTSI